MNLLFDTHCQNEFMDACPYAFLELAEELRERILHRHKLFLDLKDSVNQAGRDLDAMTYWDCSPVYLSALPDDEDGPEYGSDGWKEVAFSVDRYTSELIARTECDRMVITQDSVYWKAYPKHGDYSVETRALSIDTLRSFNLTKENVNAAS